MKTEKIYIQGLKNDQDKERAEAAVHDVWGVREVNINTSKGTITVSYDDLAASASDFKQALLDEGFQIGDVGNS